MNESSCRKMMTSIRYNSEDDVYIRQKVGKKKKVYDELYSCN